MSSGANDQEKIVEISLVQNGGFIRAWEVSPGGAEKAASLWGCEG